MVKKAAISLLLFTLAWTFMVQGISAAEKLKWGVHFKRNPYYGIPALAAEDKGIWTKQGLQTEIFEFSSASFLDRAYAAGAIDISTHGATGVVLAVSRGGPLVAVADPKMNVDFVLWVLSDSRIKKIEDLDGAKIGLSRLGVTPHVIAQMAIKKKNLEGKVKFMSMGGGAPAIAALRVGGVDALTFSNYTLLSLQAKGTVRVAVNLMDFVPGAIGAQLIVAHRDFVKKNPESVRRAIRSFLQGADFVLKNRDWAVKKIITHYRFSKEAAGLAFNIFRYGSNGRIDVKKIKDARQFVIDSGKITREKAPALKSLYVLGLSD